MKAIIISVLFAFGLVLSSCNNSTSTSDNSDNNSSKPLYTCTLYEDNNGELKNSEGERICAVKAYSRGEPMSLNLSTDVSWSGLELKKVYLRAGNVYDELPLSSNYKELTPIATYEMATQGSDLNLSFFSLADNADTKERIQMQKEKRESEQAEREKARLEADKKTWRGAESLEELKSKLNGTTWHIVTRGIVYKFVFENGSIRRYSAMAKDGKWGNDVVYFSSYEVTQKRDSGGHNFIQVSFGDLNSDLEHAPQQIAFIDKCKTVAWFINGNPCGLLTYGDYEWSDSL